MVPPGRYTARLAVGDEVREATFRLAPDPRRSATAEEQAEWEARLSETAVMLEDILTRLASLRQSRDDIAALMASHPDRTDVQQAGRAALETIAQWDHQVIQPLHETLEDEDAWETLFAGQLRFLMDVIGDTGAPVTDGQLLRLSDLASEWNELRDGYRRIQADHVAPINDWARENRIPHVHGGR